jgi:hypothetical protein
VEQAMNQQEIQAVLLNEQIANMESLVKRCAGANNWDAYDIANAIGELAQCQLDICKVLLGLRGIT